MSWPAALLVLAGLVALAALLGVLARRTGGRVRRAAGEPTVTATQLGSGVPLGATATLVQFSTPSCAVCPATARLLGAVAAARPGVVHVEVDLQRHPDVATRFAVLQTPTTLLIDGEGRLRARIGGAPRRDALESALLEITGGHRG